MAARARTTESQRSPPAPAASPVRAPQAQPRGGAPGRGFSFGPDAFLWATGIEDTFVATPHPRTGRILDEYALTEHYERWEDDLQLIAHLGVPCVRYGIPWHRVNPAPGAWDWSWTDRVLERLVMHHRITPIIDLVHYGAPLWMPRAYLEPDYAQRVAEYGAAFAERYRHLCWWYTPLNEPRIHAWYAGFLGWWPPRTRGWRGLARGLVELCRGICQTQRAIADVQPDATFVHVDATDYYEPDDPQDRELVEAARLQQALVFLALDLVTGRVGRQHPLREWLARHGVADAQVDWFARHAVTPTIIGYNMYPMFSRKVIVRQRGRLVARIRPTWTDTLAELTRMYALRYAPTPVMVTETAGKGRMSRRVAWIEESVEVVRRARTKGLAVVGYTFWPLFSLFGWAYQRGAREMVEYKLDMGLYDLRRGPGGWERHETPAVEAFRRVVAAPMTPIAAAPRGALDSGRAEASEQA